MNGPFTKGDGEMENKHMKRCSTLVIEEMQRNTAARGPYTPNRMAEIKRLKIPSVGEDAEKLLVGMKMVQAPWETLCQFLRKSNVYLSYVPAIPGLGI